MLYQWIRMINSDNGTLSDVSLSNQNESETVSMGLVATEDYLYMGQHFPFNNFFMQVDTVNTEAADIKIEYWTGEGNGWKDAVDILDGTSVSGVPVARDGVIQYSPNPNFNWHRVADSKDEPQPFGLETLRIFNIYWLRISYTNNLTGAAALKRLAYAFTLSQQLDNLDTQINSYLDSFASGKTDWNDEIVTASIGVVNDLKRKGLIISSGDILRFDDVTTACDLKALILIYKNLGPGFRQKHDDAMLDYEKALSLRRFTFDKNLNAYVDQQEIQNRVAQLVR